MAPPSIDAAQQANEAPPGYIESLLMKIKNNLSLTISNLILKYVEEDIVLSLNVKQITARPCADENWEIGITESNEHDPGIHPDLHLILFTSLLISKSRIKLKKSKVF